MLDDTQSTNEQLPALLSRAGQRLLDARTSAEVLEARQLAQAALHYARVTKAANETHADCLRIITRAEIRMANEIDRGQAAGEVAPAHRPKESVQTSDTSPPTLPDLGISRQRLAEWREVRDAGPQVVETAIQTALDQGVTPTRSIIQSHVRGTFGTGENEWYTPPEYIQAARDVLGEIDLDPASSVVAQKSIAATRFFTKEDNGLAQEWHGRIWLNPPYAQPLIAHFAEKVVVELTSGRVSAGVVLTHNYTDTTWFHAIANVSDAICFTRGRVRFVDSSGALASPTQGQAFFYFGREPDKFKSRFSSIGFVVCRVD